MGERLILAAVITFGVFVGQSVGFVLSGSHALLADTAHMALDASAEIIGLWGVQTFRRRPTEEKTYGWWLGGSLAAYTNGILLLVAAGTLMVVEIFFRHAPALVPLPMLIAASIGLAANVGIGFLLGGETVGRSEVMRSVRAHVRADAFSSLGVLIAWGVVFFSGWAFVDVPITLCIAVYMGGSGIGLVRRNGRVLLQAAPRHIDMPRLRDALRRINRVKEVPDLHVSPVGEEPVGSAHLIVLGDLTPIEQRVVQKEAEVAFHDFGVHHSTVQVEDVHRHCPEAASIPW